MGLSYDGVELLPELLRSGRWLALWREARALMVEGEWPWRTVLSRIFGPWCPAALWVCLNRLRGRNTFKLGEYSALNPNWLIASDLAACAKKVGLDLVYRPWKDGFAMRLWHLRAGDVGNYNKGILAGWQIDQRDPTADVRLLEFCFGVPTQQFLNRGITKALAKRALADRVPKDVLWKKSYGEQAADWHESIFAARGQIVAELDRLDACPPAARVLDLPRLHRLVESWPAEGWQRGEGSFAYRYTLPRAISAGHFLYQASGNPLPTAY
jgi:asparagine synthase (glutamine-hydrolysing)